MALPTSTALVRINPPVSTTTTPDLTKRNFEDVGYVVATQLLGRASRPVKHARDFVEGDHWQNGDGWIGPMPQPSDESYSDVLCLLQKTFTSRNATLEVLERHMLGVVGTEPSWGFAVKRPLKNDEKPSVEEQALIDEAETIMTEWWNKRRIHKILQEYTQELGWATRSALRLYVPAGELMETPGEQEGETYLVAYAATVEDALEKVWPDHPDHEDATVYIDPLSQRWLGITRYRQIVNWQPVGIFVYELTYVNDDGQTIITRTDQTGSAAYPFELGGRLTLWESTRQAFISDQLLSAQRALNLALSMLPRNVVTGGFLERVLLNAQMPGTWILDSEGNKVGFEPASFKTGAGTTNFVSGQTYTDEEGKTHLANPDIKWRPPSEVKPVIEAAAAAYEAILGEAKQIHILISGDATASGYSREQARADHAANLENTQSEVQPAGRWLLDTALALAEQIAGVPGHYTDVIKAVFTCRINLGPIAVAERIQNQSEFEAGLLSAETAMERGGILDVDAELQRINSTDDSKLALLEKQVAVVNTLVLAGTSFELAAKMAGIDQKFITEYTTENEFVAGQNAAGKDEFGNPLPVGHPSNNNPKQQPPLPLPKPPQPPKPTPSQAGAA